MLRRFTRPIYRLILLAALSTAALGLHPAAALAAPPEDLPVWRAQIRFETDGGSDMGTDDDIQVSLNNSNSTWLDYGRDDFEAGDVFTYDLVLANVRTLHDITQLTIRKTGDDGWCVDNLTLLINGQAIYRKSFETATTRCKWMDTDQWGVMSFTISGSTLRNYALWQVFSAARPASLTRGEFESRVQGIVGNWMETRDNHIYKWGHLYGPRYVEATPVDSRSIKVDLDMTRIYNNLPDQEADGDFEMRFTCSNGRLSLTLPEAYVWDDSPLPLDVPPMPKPDLGDQLRANLSAPLAALNATLGTASAQCPAVLVDGGGNLIVPANPRQIPDQGPVGP